MSAEYTFQYDCPCPLTATCASSVFETVDSVIVATCEAEIKGGITINCGPSSVRFESLGTLRKTIPPLTPLSGFRLTRFPARPGSFMSVPSVTVSMEAGDPSLFVRCVAADLSTAQALAISLKSALEEKCGNPVQDKYDRHKSYKSQFWKEHKELLQNLKGIGKFICAVIGAIAGIIAIIEFFR